VSDVHSKVQIRPLLRGGVLHEDSNKCQIEANLKSAYGPQKADDNKTNWPTDRRSQTNLRLHLQAPGGSLHVDRLAD
jgi:hypothetical protein